MVLRSLATVAVVAATLFICVTVSSAEDPSAATLALDAQSTLDLAEEEKDQRAKLARYREAREIGLEAIDLDKGNADAHFVVFATEGRIALLEGTIPNPVNLYNAQKRLNHVLELDPDHSHGLAAKGGLYRQLPWALGGDLKKAESYLKRAIAINPNAIGARIELAATYRDMGKTDGCVPLLDQAVAIAKQEGRPSRVEEAERLRSEILASR